MVMQRRKENAVIKSTRVGYGPCGFMESLYLKGADFDGRMDVFGGTQDADQTRLAVPEICSVVGCKSWEHLRGRTVQVEMSKRDACSGWQIDGIASLDDERSFSIHEFFERRWRAPFRQPHTCHLGVTGLRPLGVREVNAKVCRTILGSMDGVFSVGLRLRNPAKALDGWFMLKLTDESWRGDSAVAAVQSTGAVSEWERLHGSNMRALVDEEEAIVGIGHLLEYRYLTASAFYAASRAANRSAQAA